METESILILWLDYYLLLFSTGHIQVIFEFIENWSGHCYLLNRIFFFSIPGS